MKTQPTRREVLAGAAAVVAAATVPLPVAKDVDFGVEYGPPRYFVDWWDKADLDAFAHAWRPLTEGRGWPTRMTSAARPVNGSTRTLPGSL